MAHGIGAIKIAKLAAGQGEKHQKINVFFSGNDVGKGVLLCVG